MMVLSDEKIITIHKHGNASFCLHSGSHQPLYSDPSCVFIASSTDRRDEAFSSVKIGYLLTLSAYNAHATAEDVW